MRFSVHILCQGSLQSLEHIQGDICGPNQPLFGLKIEFNQFEWTNIVAEFSSYASTI